jgi:hypothetical protein
VFPFIKETVFHANVHCYVQSHSKTEELEMTEAKQYGTDDHGSAFLKKEGISEWYGSDWYPNPRAQSFGRHTERMRNENPQRLFRVLFSECFRRALSDNSALSDGCFPKSNWPHSLLF